ncbi:MAG: protein-disulfide reductase DsbD [Gammaproteobacteria bacterium]
MPQLAAAQNLLDRLTGADSPKNLGQGQPAFLDPEEAFRFNAVAKANEVILSWNIASGYYLYKERFKLAVESSEVQASFVGMPDGEMKDDPEFGRVEIYRDFVEFSAKLVTNAAQAPQSFLLVTYQGCAEDGICYPPIKKSVAIFANANQGQGALSPVLSDGARTPATKDVATFKNSATGGANSAGPTALSADRLAAEFSGRNVFSTIAIFFGFGLLLSFTPCVFPMVPILSGIIVGQKQPVTTARAFRLSLSYVLAMAATYAVVGVIAGLFGHNLQATFQQPGWIIGFSVVFVILAMSMFGFYNLELPRCWQTKLDEISRSQTGGSYIGVAIMGVLSAIIVGPCVAPPFAAALLYLSHQGSPLIGGTALFSMALGMGALLLVVGTAAGRIIPRSGGWMEGIKHFFGVLLLGVAVWFLGRILPGPIILAMWAALFVISAVYLGVLEPVDISEQASTHAFSGRGWALFKKGIGVLAIVYGVVLLVGASAGAIDPLKPLAPLAATRASQDSELTFIAIKSVDDLDHAVARAKAQGQLVMLDFFAEWCVECKHLEKNTFGNDGVQLALTDVMLLRADVTANDAVDQALLRRFELFGPPAVLFFDETGSEKREYRIQGFLGPQKFTAHLNALKQS